MLAGDEHNDWMRFKHSLLMSDVWFLARLDLRQDQSQWCCISKRLTKNMHFKDKLDSGPAQTCEL